jgi:hypothetical protein
VAAAADIDGQAAFFVLPMQPENQGLTAKAFVPQDVVNRPRTLAITLTRPQPIFTVDRI